MTWQWGDGQPPRGTDGAAVRAARRSGTVRAGVGLAAATTVALLGHPALAAVVAAIAAAGLVLAWAWPLTAYAQVERWLESVGHATGRLLSWVLLTPVFLVFFWGCGRFLRAGRRDALQRWFEPQASSYFRPRAVRPPGLDPYRRQF